jgi:hypothetical protein
VQAKYSYACKDYPTKGKNAINIFQVVPKGGVFAGKLAHEVITIFSTDTYDIMCAQDLDSKIL